MTEEIDEILQSLHRFHNKLVLQLYATDKETQTLPTQTCFHILPIKSLHKIFLFLNFSEDFPNILETCTFFNKILNSRDFQTLSYQQTLKKSVLLSKNSGNSEEESKSVYNFESINTKIEAIIEIKKNAAVNKFLSNKILNQDKIIEDLEKQINKLQTDLRIQKNIKNKSIEKISKFEEKYNAIRAEQEITSREIEKIVNLSSVEIETLTKHSEEIEKENKKFVFENKVLSKELERSKNEFQDSKIKFEVFSESIYKMKDYFETMFEPKILSLLQTFEEITI